MDRRTQIERLIAQMATLPYEASVWLENGKLRFRYRVSLEKKDARLVTAWVACNRVDIERFLSGDASLEKEEAAKRIHAQREHNGCDGTCPAFGECLCNPPCNNVLACGFCNTSVTEMPCCLVWGPEYAFPEKTAGPTYAECLADLCRAGERGRERTEKLIHERKAGSGGDEKNEPATDEPSHYTENGWNPGKAGAKRAHPGTGGNAETPSPDETRPPERLTNPVQGPRRRNPGTRTERWFVPGTRKSQAQNRE